MRRSDFKPELIDAEKRNTDGTIRNARSPMILKPRSIRARWVTDEILRCKRTGLSMAVIAVHIGRVGQGLEQPLSPVPEGIEFPANYRISESAVFKAYHKAMDRQPAINAEVFRKEDTARCEEMYLKLQSGISKGDPRHIDTGVRVLAHKAKLNGYAIEPEQVNNSGGTGLNIILNLGGPDPRQETITVSDDALAIEFTPVTKHKSAKSIYVAATLPGHWRYSPTLSPRSADFHARRARPISFLRRRRGPRCARSTT